MPLVRNKVFFHGAGNGIGNMMQTVNQSGIAFTGKSIADVGFVREMIGYSRQYDIDNTIILRYVDTPEYPQLVPDYSLPPEQAAYNVSQSLLAHLSNHAMELFDLREYFRVEIGNELRTQYDHDNPNYGNMHPVDWLGWYGYHFSRIMRQNGYRTFMYGMNAGTPEPNDWLQAGMVEFLKLCQDTYWYGLSLHEGITNAGNLDTVVIADYVPYLVGRVKFVIDACSTLNIPPPQTIISEWAWKYDDMPSLEKTKSDIDYLSEYYAQYENVVGVCLWNLDNNCGECATLPQRLANLTPFVRDYTLNTLHDVEYYNPAPEPPPTDRERLLQAALESKAIYTIPDAALLRAIVRDGRIALGNEFDFTDSGEMLYVCQYAYDIQKPEKKLVYKVPYDLWDDVTVEVYE